MPEATPAWAAGMPETAAWVIGAFAAPARRPKMANTRIRCGVDHDVLSPDSNRPPTAIAAPDTTIGTPPPQRARIRLEATAAIAMAAAIGARCSPASRGDRPRASCRYKVVRNRKPPSASKALIGV